MDAATSVSPVAALKPQNTLRGQFAARSALKSSSAFLAPSNSEAEPTEGDTPLEKAWFKDRPDIIEGIKRGLADMAAGRGTYLGSFAEYADWELDDDES